MADIQEWHDFLATYAGKGHQPEAIVVSWTRSQRAGVDKARSPLPPRVDAPELAQRLARSQALIDVARAHMQWLSASFCRVKHVIYLTDHDGIVLACEGDAELCSQFGLTPGYDWSEQVMGTNGAGTALASGKAIAVVGSQHYVDAFDNCTCVAAPIRDPQGALIGAIDLTTGVEDSGPHSIPLMSYVAHMIERELAHVDLVAESTEMRRLADRLRGREAELQHTNERLRLILDNAPVLIYLVDETGRFLNVNQGWMERIGIDSGSIIGRTVHQVFPLQTAEQFSQHNRLVLEAGTVMHFEEAYQGRTYLSVKVPVHSKQGPRHAVCGMSVDITERKEAQEALRRSEEAARQSKELLDLALAASSTGTFRFDILADEYSLFDDNLKRLFGIPADREVRRKEDFLDAVHPDDLPAVTQAVALILRDGADFDMEYRVIHPDGSVHWLFDRARAQRDSAGRPALVVGVCTDVTQRKRSEEAALAAGERFRLLAETMPQKIYTATPDGKIDYCNPQWSRFAGARAAPDQWLQAPLLHVDDIERTSRRWRECLGTGAAFECEHRLRRHDGQYRWHMSRAVPMRDQAGSIIHWIGSNTDIHDLKLLQQALSEKEAYFRELTQNMPLIVWTNLPDGSVDFVNDRWLAMTGQSLDYVRSRPDAWMAALHPDDKEQAERVYFDSVSNGRGYTTATRFRRAADGAYRWHLNRCVPIRDATGRITKFLGTSTDIDDQKQLEARLLEADRRKDEFLAVLAHELRGPLAPIASMVEVMKRVSNREELIDDACAMLERQTDYMVRLVEDLLDASRITTGKLEMRRAPLLMATVLQDAVENCLPLARRMSHELALSLPEEPLGIYGDRVRMTQVFVNLINNACRYTAPGGRIGVKGLRQGSEVVVSVKDSGKGIPQEKLSEIFDMFVQAGHRSSGDNGLGIGLTLVKRLVEMHGGTVTAQSDGAGKGSEFQVRLPAFQFPVPASGSPEKAQQHLSYRILVADDNRDAAAALALLLRTTGNQVYVANDGAEALQAAEQHRPDIVLLDLGMPKLDGYATCRRLREAPWGKTTLIIAVTGRGQDEDRRRCTAAGFDAHLLKPVRHRALMEVIAASRRAL